MKKNINDPNVLLVACQLGNERLTELATICLTERFSRGLVPFKKGHLEECWIYLRSGEVKLDLEDGGTRVIVGGTQEMLSPINTYFDELKAAVAITEIEILKVDAETIDIMLEWKEQTLEASRTHGENSEEAKTALQSSILARLPASVLKRLRKLFKRIHVREDEVIIKEGELGDAYYIIEEGSAVVSREENHAPTFLAKLQASDAFGEEALVFDENRRNATVTMSSDGVLLQLSKAHFIEQLRTPLLHGIGKGEAEGHIQMGAIWLDVRYPFEYARWHLQGAINCPLSEIRKNFDKLDRTREYIVYCQNSRRSAAAAFLLVQQGYHALYLEEGVAAMSD